jgi:hypothetical protein
LQRCPAHLPELQSNNGHKRADLNKNETNENLIIIYVQFQVIFKIARPQTDKYLFGQNFFQLFFFEKLFILKIKIL